MKKKDKNNGFKTPEGYFEGFTDRLLDKIREERTYVPGKDGFKVPEGYFDALSKKVADRTFGKKGNVVQLHPYRKYYFAAASIAAVALVILGIQWNKTDLPTFENLASTEIERYLEDSDLGLSSYEIAEAIPIETLEVNDILDEKLDEDNIIDYLEDHVDDFDELNRGTDEMGTKDVN